MIKFGKYQKLDKEVYLSGKYKLRTICYEDRVAIMQWRNEQLYHLRQKTPLTQQEQDNYFSTVVASLFKKKYPNQLIFSLFQDERHIAYGGLVHIDWKKSYAELSFVMDTKLEELFFEDLWAVFLRLIEDVAKDLKIDVLYTAAYDIRPKLYKVLEGNNYERKENIENYTHLVAQQKTIVHAKTIRNA